MTEHTPSILNGRRSVLLVLFVLGALVVVTWQPLTLYQMMNWGRTLSGEPFFLLLIIIGQALLFAFALPGTLMIWAVAPFQPPIIAVPVMLTGSLLGAVGGYKMSRQLGHSWLPARTAWFVKFLQEHSGLVAQTALRVLPGCPHWALNYSAGMLNLPRGKFMLAAVIGLSVKWWVYTSTIYGATTAAYAEQAVGPNALVPLIVLAVLLIIGAVLRQYLVSRYGRG